MIGGGRSHRFGRLGGCGFRGTRRRGGGDRVDGNRGSRGRLSDEIFEADRYVELGIDDEAEGHLETEDLGELPGQRAEQPGLDGAAGVLVAHRKKDEGIVDERLRQGEGEEPLLMGREVWVLFQV